MTKALVINPYIIAAATERRRALRAANWGFLSALVVGFAYAQLARLLGAPSGFIGLTAIIAQAATFYAVLLMKLGAFWRVKI